LEGFGHVWLDTSRWLCVYGGYNGFSIFILHLVLPMTIGFGMFDYVGWRYSPLGAEHGLLTLSDLHGAKCLAVCGRTPGPVLSLSFVIVFLKQLSAPVIQFCAGNFCIWFGRCAHRPSRLCCGRSSVQLVYIAVQ